MEITKKILLYVILTSLILSIFVTCSIFFVQSQAESLFQVTIIVPSSNPARQEWAKMVENNLFEAGIDATRVLLDWETIYDRALNPTSESIGKTYRYDGFDMLFYGYEMSVDPDVFSLYHSSQIPSGQNYYLWENEENDRLCRLIMETVDKTQRLEYLRDWQQLAYEELPSIPILYTKEVVVFDPTTLVGDQFEIMHYPVWPAVEKWKLNTSTNQTTVTLAHTLTIEENLNPWIKPSHYDLVIYGAVFDSLAKRENLETLTMIPGMATGWEVADDNKTWTVNLRHGVMWHDGFEFTAEDVKFTYTAAMTDELASDAGAFVEDIIGSTNNIEIVDKYTVKFYLPEPYAYFVEEILSEKHGLIIPAHILNGVPYSEWRNHPFNTGKGNYTIHTPNDTITVFGPVGTGPYQFKNLTTFDNPILNGNINYLIRFDDYWNAQNLWDAGLFEIQEYQVKYIEGSDVAVTSLKKGDVDVLDSYYNLETKLDSIEDPWGDWISYDAFGVQELGINMRHPILGTGELTPLGQEDPSRAAEAARYIRMAISHLIPRQDIIDTILEGYATPAITPITTLTFGLDSTLKSYSYDLHLAKSYLAAAGYDTGVEPIPTPMPTTSPTPTSYPIPTVTPTLLPSPTATPTPAPTPTPEPSPEASFALPIEGIIGIAVVVIIIIAIVGFKLIKK